MEPCTLLIIYLIGAIATIAENAASQDFRKSDLEIEDGVDNIFRHEKHSTPAQDDASDVVGASNVEVCYSQPVLMPQLQKDRVSVTYLFSIPKTISRNLIKSNITLSFCDGYESNTCSNDGPSFETRFHETWQTKEWLNLEFSSSEALADDTFLDEILFSEINTKNMRYPNYRPDYYIPPASKLVKVVKLRLRLSVRYEPVDNPRTVTPTAISTLEEPFVSPSTQPSIFPSTNEPSIEPSWNPSPHPTRVPRYTGCAFESVCLLRQHLYPSKYQASTRLTLWDKDNRLLDFVDSFITFVQDIETLDIVAYGIYTIATDKNYRTNSTCDWPSGSSSDSPSDSPSDYASSSPSNSLSGIPSVIPSVIPSGIPSGNPSSSSSNSPSSGPSSGPNGSPSGSPSDSPSDYTSSSPSNSLSGIPSGIPSGNPSGNPSSSASISSSVSDSPTTTQTSTPTVGPTVSPTTTPTSGPTHLPTSSDSDDTAVAPVNESPAILSDRSVTDGYNGKYQENFITENPTSFDSYPLEPTEEPVEPTNEPADAPIGETDEPIQEAVFTLSPTHHHEPYPSTQVLYHKWAASYSGWGVEAWFCDPFVMENRNDPIRTLPKNLTSFTPSLTGPLGGVVTVCIATFDEFFRKNITVKRIVNFTWNDYMRQPEQVAIVNGDPADIMTSYNDRNCDLGEWCYFTTVLSTDFFGYPSHLGNVHGHRYGFGVVELSDGVWTIVYFPFFAERDPSLLGNESNLDAFANNVRNSTAGGNMLRLSKLIWLVMAIYAIAATCL